MRLNYSVQGAHNPQGARRIRKAAKPPTAAQGTPLQTQSVGAFLSAACANCECLPEIATAPLGPRNDNSGVHTILTVAWAGRQCAAGRDMPLRYNKICCYSVIYAAADGKNPVRRGIFLLFSGFFFNGFTFRVNF